MCDLDLPLIFGATPYPLPIHLGHECVAEVVEGPEGFDAGDRVIVPFQVSCSTCARCRRGLTGYCETAGPLSMYGFGADAGEWGGRCKCIGQLAPEAPLPLWEMYRRGVHLHIGPGMARPAIPAIPAILDLAAAGRLRPELVTSRIAAWEDAAEAVLEPTTKLVVSRA